MPSHLNVEIKARCDDPKAVLQRLQRLGAVLQGVDRQVDTYFHAATGRLKLRTGNIENSLIHYRREDHAGPKDSHVTLIETRAEESGALRSLLAGALGILVEVDKLRHILWIDNVKFHVDEVRGWVPSWRSRRSIEPARSAEVPCLPNASGTSNSLQSARQS